jgi:hypothetical protein
MYLGKRTRKVKFKRQNGINYFYMGSFIFVLFQSVKKMKSLFIYTTAI